MVPMNLVSINPNKTFEIKINLRILFKNLKLIIFKLII